MKLDSKINFNEQFLGHFDGNLVVSGGKMFGRHK